MLIDLAAPNGYDASPVLADDHTPVGMSRAPKILVFDSGLGGLTVHAEVTALRPDADYLYVADDAAFPYGRWAEPDLVARVVGVIGRFITSFAPDLVVIACNTASTLVLPNLRGAFPAIPFVGTVPAIKPAAALSRSKMISVLATPGTVARDYTHALIESFAADCRVTLVGSTALAGLAEAAMSGGTIDKAAIKNEIAPCFVADGATRTDCVVLACTHYPLLRDQLVQLAPWPVTFIDPAPAIARRCDAVLVARGFPRKDAHGRAASAIMTSGRGSSPAFDATLRRFGLAASTPHGGHDEPGAVETHS